MVLGNPKLGIATPLITAPALPAQLMVFVPTPVTRQLSPADMSWLMGFEEVQVIDSFRSVFSPSAETKE